MNASLTIIALVLIVSCTWIDSHEDQLLAHANPEDYGLDHQEIGEIKDHIKWAIDSAYISGAVALVAKDDKIIYHEAFGYSDRTKKNPMNRDNLFRLASMTKPITSTAVMQLVEQGKISLQDPVSKYIPDFSEFEVLDEFDETDSSYTTKPLTSPITIHHLLTHTSGIPYSLFHPVAGKIYPRFGFKEAWTKEAVTLGENIPKQANAPLMHQPGEKWTYGTGIDVLGYVVEIVSGLTLDKYFEQNLFGPLDMQDTYFYLPVEKADRLVDVWFTADIEESSDESIGSDYPIAGAKTYFPGGAGLTGTAMDYLKFATALKNRGVLGDSRILQPATVAMMMNNQMDTLRSGSGGQAFGYGGMVLLEDDESGRNAGTWGWAGYWQTHFRIDPQNDLIYILMSNAYGTPKWNRILAGYDEMVVQAIED